jgi:nitronate monooxygenase
MTPARYQTRMTELLGIRHPILCGGLMYLADATYVAAVVNAGAMGFITSKSFPDPGAYRGELQRCAELTGGKPFGVNLYYSLRPEANEVLLGHTEILLEEGVRIIETSGLPPKELLPILKAAGCTVIHKVSTVRHALSAQKLDIDALSVVGAECGGHPGVQLVGTMVQGLVAAQKLRLPLAIGGGIGHGAQLVAALAFGADAVILGTRMTVAEEIWAHSAYKERLIEVNETDTILVLQSLRNTYRALDNKTARAVAGVEATGTTEYEHYAPLVAGALQKEAYETGDWNKGILSVGQSAAFADAVQPVAAILDQLLAEAAEAERRLAGVAVKRGERA